MINILNQGGPTLVGDLSLTGDDGVFYDVNGDGLVTPLDALIIINEINRRGGGQAEAPSGSGGTKRGLDGEGEAAPLKIADAKEKSAEPIVANPTSHHAMPRIRMTISSRDSVSTSASTNAAEGD